MLGPCNCLSLLRTQIGHLLRCDSYSLNTSETRQLDGVEYHLDRGKDRSQYIHGTHWDPTLPVGTLDPSPPKLTANLGAGMTEMARGVRPWIWSRSNAERARSGMPAGEGSRTHLTITIHPPCGNETLTTRDNQWPSFPTCYCANFSEDLRSPVTDWAKATRQHKEIGKNF